MPKTLEIRKLAILLVTWTLLGSAAQACRAEEPAGALKLLFLGDNGHHQPAKRFAQLQPVLADRGIVLEYTDDMQDVSLRSLGRFDGLLLYANIDDISSEQAEALLEYVAGGRGFIPLHCASFCFRNNDDVVSLIGAQFQRHGTGVFRVEPTDASRKHPLMKGYGGFESWDETYVHTRHNEHDRVVLEYRLDNEGREPWTWVRTHGKGRVFYTAWGHDERTWSNEGFQNLVERGIRWACGDEPGKVPAYMDRSGSPRTGPENSDRPQMTPPRQDVAPFEFADAVIPFYPPGKSWGKTEDPITRLQKPLPAEESLKHFVAPVGFHVELFAAEPEIGKPIAMNWDERGRLWLCETVDYPNDLQPPGEGRDRIRICWDTDGDGRADRFTVFAEGLSIPTAIACFRGGVIVQDGAQTVFLKDTDGDDRADVRKVLIADWELGDTHGGVSNFQYGLDNWIWGMQGYNRSEPKFEGKTGPTFAAGFFRFRLDDGDPPRVTDLEFMRSTNNNTWGLGFSESGVVFGSTANGNPSEYLPIPNRYYERVRGWSSSVLGGIAESNAFEPITENVRQVDHHGGFTSAAGHALYTARAWPREYWDRTAFVAEPTGHLIATFVISQTGAGYRSKNSWNILASDDEWSAPIVAEVGPDGQLWVIDWYNIIVQHNPTPAGYKTGKGNAYEIDLRDKKHGRVYRMVYSGDEASKSGGALSTLAGATPAQLVTALADDNFLWRRQAQRILVERGQRDVTPALVKLIEDRTVDAIGLNPGAVHALWTLNALGVFAGKQSDASAVHAALAALTHPSAAVRRSALQVLPQDERLQIALLKGKLLDDADPQVRLAAYLTLAETPPSLAAADAIRVALASSSVGGDRWLLDAATAAAARHDRHFLRGVAGSLGAELAAPPDPLLAIVAEHYARSAPGDDVGELLESLAQSLERLPPSVNADATCAALLAGLAKGWPKDQTAELNADAEARLVGLLDRLNPAGKTALINLATTWGVKSLEAHIAAIAASALAVVENQQVSDAERLAAAQQFMELRRADEAAPASLLELITARASPDLAIGLIAIVGNSESPETGKLLADNLSTLTPGLRGTAIGVLLGRPEWTVALLDALDANQLQLADLALDQKQALSEHPNAEIADRAKVILSRGGGLPNPDRQKVLEELLPLAQHTGDAALGKEVFKKQCAKCHTHSGEGSKVGPDLTGMAVHPKRELLVHLVDPSRNVEGNFRVYTVVLVDGRILNGLLASESQTAIEIIDSEAKRHSLLREDIDELAASPKSLMPDGFEKQVTRDEIANLLEFLTLRGKFLPIPLDKAATVVSTKGMFYSEDADVERLIFPDWSPKTFEGVPFVLVDPQGDRVANVVMLRGPHGTIPPKMPAAVTLPCNAQAKAIHLLSGVGGWSFPAEPKGGVSLIVRLHYADGDSEDHELINGEHFADYIRRVDVPGSKFAFALRGQQVRYLAVYPKRAEKVETIELVKGNDRTAPVVMAVTVESP